MSFLDNEDWEDWVGDSQTPLAKPKKVKTWTTRDGTVLKIKDMESSHILNCMAMLLKADQFADLNSEAYKAFARQLLKRNQIPFA